MKRVFVLALIVLTVFSCGDEVKFNTPAVQGKKNGNPWRATFYDVSFNSANRIEISGSNGNETLIFTVPNLELGGKYLGRGSSSKAEFFDAEGRRFSTNSLPDPVFQLYPPDGEIEITQLTATSVSGRFWFNAFTQSGLETVNFSQGVFFDVPIFGLGGGLMNCDEAEQALIEAEEVFNNTDQTSSQYPEVCEAYKEALINRIAICGGGGANSPFQIIINGLGDCE